jgi:hypothetical protein
LTEFIESSPFNIPKERLQTWLNRSSIGTIARQYAEICCLNSAPTPERAEIAPNRSTLEVILRKG